MRVLSFGRVACRNQKHACHKVAALVDDTGRGAHLGLDMLLFNRRARGQQRSQFRVGGLTPGSLLRRRSGADD
jgi:hypothetical protein